MKLGGDFFKIFNFAVQIIRLFFRVFGDEDDKQAAYDSEKRSCDGNANAC